MVGFEGCWCSDSTLLDAVTDKKLVPFPSPKKESLQFKIARNKCFFLSWIRGIVKTSTIIDEELGKLS